MDLNWWKQSKGTKTNDSDEFQDLVEAAGNNKIIVVDFFMPACKYCVDFMPSWNKIVDEFTAEYGDQVEFVKVDGTQDDFTASRYSIQSFPSFIILEPGSYGDQFNTWRTPHRDYLGMKKWIKNFAGNRITPIDLAIIDGDEPIAQQLAMDAKPIGFGVPPTQISALLNKNKVIEVNTAAAIVENQIEEEKHLADAIENMITQQQQNTQVTQTLSENVEHMLESQGELQLQLNPVLVGGDSVMSDTNSMTIFLAGISLGVLLGLFFASYLLRMNRGVASRKGDFQRQLQNSSASAAAESNMTQTVYSSSKDEVVVKRQESAASMRTGSTNSGGSDNDNEEHAQSNNATETDKLL